MPTWHRDAVEGLELLVVEIERLDRELVPVLHELLGALPALHRPSSSTRWPSRWSGCATVCTPPSGR
ncbi:MAG: hypothetical protein R2755_32190 [Acidimicrobiales bacterium]